VEIYVVSYNNRVALEWRHWPDRKLRTQNAEAFRRKHEGNEYKHCCTFHVLG